MSESEMMNGCGEEIFLTSFKQETIDKIYNDENGLELENKATFDNEKDNHNLISSSDLSMESPIEPMFFKTEDEVEVGIFPDYEDIPDPLEATEFDGSSIAPSIPPSQEKRVVIVNNFGEQKIVSYLEVQRSAVQQACRICNRVYPNLSALAKHNRYCNNKKVNKNVNKFPCKYCKVVYGNERALEVHMQVCLNWGGQHFCPHCGVKFQSDLLLSGHLVFCVEKANCLTVKRTAVQSGETDVPRKIINLDGNEGATVVLGNIVPQRKLKSAAKHSTGYVCSINCCGEKFSNQKLLERHEEICRTYKVICHVCGQRFQTSKQYNNHMTTHRELESKKIKCGIPYCLATFKNAERLKIHESRCRFKYEQLQEMEQEKKIATTNNNPSKPSVSSISNSSKSSDLNTLPNSQFRSRNATESFPVKVVLLQLPPVIKEEDCH